MLIASKLNIEAQTFRVRSRESKTIEFKSKIDKNILRKCIKTVAGFGNTSGGSIIFGISDSPRNLVGIDGNQVPDQAEVDDLLEKHLSPVPDFDIISETVFGREVLTIQVRKYSMPPNFKIADLSFENKVLMHRGCVYMRRAEKSIPGRNRRNYESIKLSRRSG